MGATAAILLAAVVQQSLLGLNPDTSWLITVSERVLGGDRLYLDIQELNPPASVALYLPWVALAEALGLKAEPLVAAATFALGGLAFLLAGGILRHSALLARRDGEVLLVAAAWASFLLVGNSFAQREHIALLTLLPWLALMAARAEQRAVPLWLALLAGAGAGITMVIKPPFLLAVGLPLLAAAARRRSPSVLLGVDCWTGATLLGLYAAGVVLFTPAFFSVALPLAGDGYFAVRHSLDYLLISLPVLLAAMAAATALMLVRRNEHGGPAGLLLLAALGFAAAMLVQGKGFSNHHYPALALALVALALAAVRQPGGRERRLGLLILVALGLSGAWGATHMRLYRDVVPIIRAHAPERPKVIVAATNLVIGHPLTRWVDGHWVGTRASLWVTGTAAALLAGTDNPAHRARLRAKIDEDRRLWIEDVRRHRPDVVLVDLRHGGGWIRANSDVAAVLRPYRAAGSAQNILVLVRAP